MHFLVCVSYNFKIDVHYLGHVVVQLFEALGWKLEVHLCDSLGVTGLFHLHNSSSCTMALGLTQPLIEMSTMNISWGVKVAGACGWQPYHFRVLIFLKSGNLNLLEPSGPEYTLTGIALPLHVLFHEVLIMEVQCVFCETKTEFLYLSWISFEFKSVCRRINGLRHLKKKWCHFITST